MEPARTPTLIIRPTVPSRHPPRRNRDDGFTLIELVLVILILGLFAASLIPNEAYRRFQLEAAVARVENDLLYCKELAAMKNVRCGVSFVALGDYTVYENNSGNPATDPLTRRPFVTDLSQEFGNVHVLNSMVVEFDSLGRPVVGGGSTIQIGNGTTTRNLNVIANTGLVQRL